jgi:tripartite-type tricarboxylate transporter receptor subunit TctC
MRVIFVAALRYCWGSFDQTLEFRMTWFLRAPIVLVLLLLGALGPSLAQTYPDRVIKLIAPNPPGGLGDLLLRTFGDYVTAKTGQPTVIENRAGASGNVAWESVARATPDGYTIGLVNTGVVINKFMFRSLRYDVFDDLIPVAPIGDAPQLFFIHGKLPPKTVPEFVAFAKEQSRKLTYGSAGIGSPPHLAGDQLSRRIGVEMVHVPYRGVAPAITDVIAGHIDSIPVSIGPIRAAVDSGAARPLFALTPKRLSYFPDIPAAAEVGLVGLHMSTWFALVAPRGTAAAIVEQLNGYAHGMLADEASMKRIAGSRLETMKMTPAEFAAFIKSQAPLWEGAVRDAGLLGKIE